MRDLPRCALCASERVRVFGHKNGYTLFSCGACGLRFVYPVPDSAALYAEGYFKGATEGFGYVDYDKDKQPMTPTFEEYLRRIRQFMPEGGRLLDVGAATGFFLPIAHQAGFEASGVEISPYAALRAREKGLDVITGSLGDVPSGKAFDVLTMFDVIEHVADPAAEIERAHGLVRPGGMLVVNTPDAGSAWARLLGKRWHLIVPPEHLYYFNRAAMRKLLEDRGFRVLSITSVGKRFTLQYIFRMAYGWQKLSLWKWLSDICANGWLSRVAIPIDLRDNMFVLARKSSV